MNKRGTASQMVKASRVAGFLSGTAKQVEQESLDDAQVADGEAAAICRQRCCTVGD